MDDPGLKDNTELQKTLLRTFSRIIPNSEPKFREECKLTFCKNDFTEELARNDRNLCSRCCQGFLKG